MGPEAVNHSNPFKKKVDRPRLSNDAARLKYSTLKENNVTQLRNFPGQTHKLAAGFSGLVLVFFLALAVLPASAQSRPKAETIEATASGTDFQAGQLVTVTFSIYEYSPLSDQQILNDAFQKGKDQGLYNALSKCAQSAISQSPARSAMTSATSA